ncbi:MAG: hypothetical protein ACREV5_15060 [Steroidobacter sp.]
MDENKALTIVSALANGVNPITGEVFASDSPYQSSEVVRALHAAARSLEAGARAKPRTSLPSNAGKPWTEEEDRKLLSDFDRGRALQDLAQAHERTVAGIQARLEKHGRLESNFRGRNASPQRGNGGAPRPAQAGRRSASAEG